MKMLESFHLNFLKRIQSLPTTTATCIVYLLLGCRPITAEIHLRQLSLLGSIIRSQNQRLKDIMIRQTAVKDETSKSWFINILDILEKYDLPNIQMLLQLEMSKQKWKTLVKQKVDTFWTNTLLEECTSKTSLKNCYYEVLKIGKPHPVWENVKFNVKDVRRASVKCRMMTGTYTLQSTLAKYNKAEVNPLCPMCCMEDEDMSHFICRCNALHQYRYTQIQKLQDIISTSNPDVWSSISSDTELLAGLILDCSKFFENGLLSKETGLSEEIETITRNLCFNLHCGRTHILNKTKLGQ